MDDLKTLINQPEDEYHDFKEKWYTPFKKAELVKDILSFANTSHHQDCYLIFGVTDKTGEIVGVENDGNRRNTQQLTDFLRQLQIRPQAPHVTVETINFENHEVDVLTIKDSDHVPMYLGEKSNFKGSNQIYPGQIFARENDVNTSINQTAEDYQVERLWKKRFRIGSPIIERYKYVLEDFGNWVYFSTDSGSGFRYEIDPNFDILLEDDDENDKRDKFNSISLSQLRGDLGWYIMRIRYDGRSLRNNIYAYSLDGARFFASAPQGGCIGEIERNPLTYNYYLCDSLEYKLQIMLNSTSFGGISPDDFQWDNLQKNVVFYKNEQERNAVEQELRNHLTDIFKRTLPSNNEKILAKGRLPSIKNVDDADLTYMVREINVTRYIKSYLGQLLVGNCKTKLYHESFQNSQRISSANRVYFNSKFKAQAAGYRKALR